jgi:hypothetical protein
MTNVSGLNGWTLIASTVSKNRLNVKMSKGKDHKQAIKRVSGEKYHDEHMAVYWGRDDDAIHVIARLTLRAQNRQ